MKIATTNNCHSRESGNLSIAVEAIPSLRKDRLISPDGHRDAASTAAVDPCLRRGDKGYFLGNPPCA
ncbi:MAG: hypothetical protein HYX79_06630 [Chloroflexi bacterium]|nr:hypothetical protein [Chloroflexota bacterium]